MMRVIIPSDNPALARRCVQSIAELDPEILPFVVVVTGTAEMFALGEQYPIGVIRRPEPFVYAQAVNTAIEYYTNELEKPDFFLLNDDCVLLTANGLSVMSRLGSYQELGVVSAGIKGVGGSLLQQVETTGMLRLVKAHVSFAAALITHTALEKVGLLDEQFDAYGHEDVDYTERVMQAGLSIGVFDGCVVRHNNISSTFGERGAFSIEHIRGENQYWRKHGRAGSEQGPPLQVVVVGASRSGSSVVAHALHGIGIEMMDPAPPISPSSSAYYRDDEIARLLKHGREGAELYVHRRNQESPDGWGTRIWPSVDAAKMLMSEMDNPHVIVVKRSAEAIRRSYAASNGQAWEFTDKRIARELADLDELVAWAIEQDFPHIEVNFTELIHDTHPTLLNIVGFLGLDTGVTGGAERVIREFYHFDTSGELFPWPRPEGWGKVAIGVRINKHPEALSVGSLMRMVHEGLREGDVLLDPSYGTPAHFAATNLMRSFLQTDCDSLLLIDDDMVFNSDLLEKMRSNEENWRYGIVSALATQRVQPPRALVLRRGAQPSYPDSTNGTFYGMLVDEVESGTVMEVDGTGMAFTLIRREVIEAMTGEKGPQFTHYVQWGQGGEGEDIRFCREAGSLGYRTAVDCSCHIGHIGIQVYGYDEFDYWRRTGRAGTGMNMQKLTEFVGQAVPHLSGTPAGKQGVELLKRARDTDE